MDNREKQINESAESFGRMRTVDKDMAVAFGDAFKAGARWADSHPHWISIEDELPKIEDDYSDFSIKVLATDGEDVYKAMLHNDGTWFTHDLWVYEGVTHWMPLPTPPKKGE